MTKNDRVCCCLCLGRKRRPKGEKEVIQAQKSVQVFGRLGDGEVGIEGQVVGAGEAAQEMPLLRLQTGEESCTIASPVDKMTNSLYNKYYKKANDFASRGSGARLAIVKVSVSIARQLPPTLIVRPTVPTEQKPRPRSDL